MRRRVYSFLSQISNFLSQPFLNMANSMTEIPILSAFLLGIVGAMAPCQLTGNLGAITYTVISPCKRNGVERVVPIYFGKIIAFPV